MLIFPADETRHSTIFLGDWSWDEGKGRGSGRGSGRVEIRGRRMGWDLVVVSIPYRPIQFLDLLSGPYETHQMVLRNGPLL